MAKRTCQLWKIRMALKALELDNLEKARIEGVIEAKIEMSTFCPQSSTLLGADF